MAASKAPKKAPTKTAATKKAAAKKIKQAPKKTKTAPGGDIPIEYKVVPKSALRVAEEAPGDSTGHFAAPEETITDEVEEIPAPVVQRPGRVAPIKVEPVLPVLEKITLVEVPPASEMLPAGVPVPDAEVHDTNVVDIPETHKPKILDVIKSLWQRVENWKYYKWVWRALIVLAVLYAVDTFFVLKRNYDIKQTKKIEAKVAQKEAQVQLTDSSIAEMQRLGDSLREVSDSEIEKAIKHTKASQEANQKRVNLIKLQHYELENKIKSLNNNDERRRLQKQLTSPQ